MLHAVIMAGGAGTRFWPASRADRPKQLLKLAGERTMLQATLDRLKGLVPRERTMVLTNQRLVPAVVSQLPELEPSQVLGEPAKRDTAPCIGLAALIVRASDPDATLVVLPADHVIEPNDKFQDALRQAGALVDGSPSRIVTFGIRPTYPAETFGYIERGEPLLGSSAAAPAFAVRRFHEKPKADVAKKYLDAGNFSWNSGIFVFRAETILAELKTREPEMVARLEPIAAAAGRAEFQEVFAREFQAIRGVSIDYAVMEHAADVAVIEAPFRWDDVGGWQSLARLRGADGEGNTIVGRHLGIRTKGTIVYGEPEHLIVTLGMSDCIIVETPDATLVANRHDEESIRELVRELEKRGWTEFL